MGRSWGIMGIKPGLWPGGEEKRIGPRNTRKDTKGRRCFFLDRNKNLSRKALCRWRWLSSFCVVSSVSWAEMVGREGNTWEGIGVGVTWILPIRTKGRFALKGTT